MSFYSDEAISIDAKLFLKRLLISITTEAEKEVREGKYGALSDEAIKQNGKWAEYLVAVGNEYQTRVDRCKQMLLQASRSSVEFSVPAVARQFEEETEVLRRLCASREREIIRPSGLTKFWAPIWDTEIIDPASMVGNVKLTFFQRPLGGRYGCWPCSETTKGRRETSMFMTSMLEYPVIHDITGFGLYVEDGVLSLEDKVAIAGGDFVFGAPAHREVLFSREIRRFPNFSGLQESLDEAVDAILAGHAQYQQEKKEDRKSVIKETKLRCVVKEELGKDGVPARIKPAECFSIELRWKNLAKLSRPVKIMVVLDGFRWVNA
jgi:hypothetical protein